MSSSPSLSSQVLATLKLRLVSIGLRHRRAGLYTLDVQPGFVGWLGLNHATDRIDGQRVVTVYPMVGVRSEQIERLVAELTGEKFRPYTPPTVACNIGFLMPRGLNTHWYFYEDEPLKEPATALTAAVKQYGLPYMRNGATLESVWDEQVAGQGYRESLQRRLPVTALILGRGDEARRLVERFVAERQGRWDPEAEHYREFAQAFIARLEADRPTTG